MAYLRAMRFCSDWLSDTVNANDAIEFREEVVEALRKLILFDTAIVLEAYAISMQRSASELARAREVFEGLLWSAESMAELHEEMAGSTSVEELGQRTLRYLCRRLDAQVGAFYVSDDGGLQLAATSALASDVPARFATGEGLVGRAAAEAKRIVVSDVPSDGLRVSSGLASVSSCHLVVTPVLHDNEVQGVLELASVSTLSERAFALLDNVGSIIAQSILTLQSRARVEELLAESQAQAEELEAQQEELRDTNAHLEKQTRLLARERETVEARNREIARARQALQERADELALASQYKSEFLANMSHELRTPLNSLLILTRLLADNRDRNLTEKQVEYAETIRAAGSELQVLIDEILDLSKIESGKMTLDLEDYSISELRPYLERTFGPVARQRELDFEISISSDLPPVVRTDPQRLQQILKNLLSNAFKFTRRGRVRFEAGPASDTGAVNPGVGSDERVIALSVSDTGIGIPEDEQESIFDAFHQIDGGTRRQFGGTGLGLSISRQIARLLGGEISLESTAGEGSTFTLYLPLVHQPSEEAAAADPADREADDLAAQGDVERGAKEPRARSLLIIEDDPLFAGILRDLADQRGFEVLIAGNGDAGLAAARTAKPDAITLDIRLPDVSGWVVLDQLKNDTVTRDIPVHVISVDADPARGIQHGAVTVLKKPVDAKALSEAFDAIERHGDEAVKRLLVVEDDEVERRGIVELMERLDVATTAVATGRAALATMAEQRFDCMVLDLGLPDMSGFDVIDSIQRRPRHRALPVVVYTGRDLTREERFRLREATDTVILKDARSADRLLAEVALFLHRVEAGLPQSGFARSPGAHVRDDSLVGKRALLVDDDMRNIFALTSLLERHGMKVGYAETGTEAIEVLGQHPDDYDIVLMDIMMPEMDGYEATRALRQMPGLADIPIVTVTAKAMKDDREKCLDAGANDYLAKPVEADQLLTVLRAWLCRDGEVAQ
jgi:CheY-like chemotaxis protein/signal transduction histidine kinase